MTALRIDSTKGTVLLNLSNVAGALLTKTDDGVEFIALTMIAGANVKAIICLAQDGSKIDGNYSHIIEIDFPAERDELNKIMNDIERGM